MINRSRILRLAGLILFAIGLLWLSERLPMPQPDELDPRRVARHDYIIESLKSTQLDKRGKPLYTLEARRLTHYPNRKLSLLDQPVLTRFPEQGKSVRTRADRAELPDDGKRIIMHGRVRITRQGDEKQAGIRAETDTLEILLPAS